MRFELTTLTLARLCSTPELRPHRLDEGQISDGRRGCKGENAAARVIYAFTVAAADKMAVAM